LQNATFSLTLCAATFGGGMELIMSEKAGIDQTTAKKGTGKKTLWEFVKFTIVALLATVVQYTTLNILIWLPFIKDLYATPFKWFVFDYPVNLNAAGIIVSGALGYFIAFNSSNILAQIVAFFVNKEKTFKSGANVAVTLPIYIVFTILLICFSAWLSPMLNTFFIGKGIGGQTSTNIAAMVCSGIQFFVYFPVDKVLFRKPKEAKSGNK
jgi:putative flippase GtrA